MRGPRGIPLHVRAEAVARVEAGEARRRVAREIGVSEATIRGWERSTTNPAPGSHQEKVRQTADEISEEIAEAQRECRRILIQRLRQELPNAKARPAELATCYGILTDKDIKWQQMRAEAEARGAHTPLSDLDREQLEARAEALRAMREGRH